MATLKFFAENPGYDMSKYANIMTRIQHNPIKRRRTQPTRNCSVPPLHTRNRFSPLEQDEEMIDWNESDAPHVQREKSTTTKTRISKPPPIKITDDKFNQASIKTYTTELNISAYQSKNMSIGIKIEMDKKEDYDKFIAKLIADKISFFTHRDKDQKEFKVVLSGLPKIETNIVVDELKKCNITATSVSELTTKNVNPNYCLYLLQFSKNDVTLAQLRKIRAIDHVIVDWKPFISRNKGPTQCRNCSMLGHGAQNCHRTPACMLCASTDHVAADCKFKESSSDAFVFKCFNCAAKKLNNTNHNANDPRCPCRNEYLEIRNKVNHRNIVRSNKQIVKSNTFNLRQESFPGLKGNTGIYGSTQFDGPSFAEQVRRNPGNEELYSMDDLFEIFQTAVEDLMACSNKGQQLKVLFKLLSNAFK